MTRLTGELDELIAASAGRHTGGVPEIDLEKTAREQDHD